MNKQLLLTIFILIIFTISAQTSVSEKTRDVKKENEIIQKAKNVIGIETSKTNSVYLKLEYTFATDEKNQANNLNGVFGTEISSLLPDKIQLVNTMNGVSNSKTTSIWNADKYKKLSEFEMMGERIVKDTTESDKSNDRFKLLEGKIDKEKLDKLKKASSKDPKESFYNQVWMGLFPLILNNPFEQNLDFKFVGKAKAGIQTADVVEFTSQNGRKYKLLFDAETSFLLMMIESFSGTDGDYENKHYYSNREKVNNVLIPRKIKVENKFTPTGKEPRISYMNIDILEFKLNPELKESLFEIK